MMNKKGSSSTGIAIVLILIILAAGFFMASSKWKSDSSIAVNNDGSKETVKCALYSDGIYKNEYKAGDDKALPQNIASISKDLGATLCGSISSLGYVYYLSNADDQTIIDTYKDSIQKDGCTPDDPIKGKDNSAYSYNMHYTCKDGDGNIATDARRKAFYVGFNTMASPTDAVSNANGNMNGNANGNINSNSSNSNVNGNLNSNSNSNSSKQSNTNR